MAITKDYLDDIHEAYASFWLPPDHVEQFRRQPSDPDVPTELDVLFFMPQMDGKSDNVTAVTTAGMSTRLMHGPYPKIEIGYEFMGGCSDTQIKEIARTVADLAVLPFRDSRCFTPKMLLDGLELPPFQNMTTALLTHWDIHAEVAFPCSEPPTVFLRLISLYESEAKYVEEVGALQAIDRFLQKGLVIEDFERSPMV